MARNQKMADTTAEYYKRSKAKIAKLKAERKKLEEKNKTERSAQILSTCMSITRKIQCEEQDLDSYAHLIVKYIYGDEEEADEQQI